MSRFPLGVLAVAGALFMSRAAVEQLFAADQHVSEGKALCVLVSRGALLAAGLWVMVSGKPAALRGVWHAGVLTVLAVTAGLGVLGTLLDERIVNPDVPALEELAEAVHDSPTSHLSETRLKEMESRLDEMRSADALDRAVFERDYAEELLRRNETTEAIEVLERARARIRDEPVPRAATVAVLSMLGVAYLRSGEVSQCIQHHNPQRCLFPVRGDGRWSDPALALQAIDCFEEVLSLEPDQPGARWLLNIAHMVAGGYPDEVPERYRLPASALGETSSPVRFEDVAGRLGLDVSSLLGGAIVEDFDGDGLLDVVVSSYDPAKSLHLFRNDGRGGFEDRTAEAGLAEQVGGSNLVQADYDDDGRMDFLILRGGWMTGAAGGQPNSLLRQLPDGSFSDVSIESGVGLRAYPSHSAAWADYDSDGDLDLYVGNERHPCELFRNEGDGTFAEVARELGVLNNGWTKGVAWGDFDNDGDPDLYVSNFGDPNRLYRNDGDGFHDVAEDLHVSLAASSEQHTFLTWFFDADNDGWLDLFVGGYPFRPDLDLVAADYLGTRVTGPKLRLFKNDRRGGFEDVTVEQGLDHVRFPMGGNYGDVDNDGFPDIYLGTGAPGFDFLIPNLLLHNERGVGFTDISSSAGVGHLQKGHAIGFGDLDNDGDQDIVAEMGGFYGADTYRNAVFENSGSPNRCIQLTLLGTRSNRAGIGARIRVTFVERGIERSVHRVVSSGGSFGASCLRQAIGVGSAERVAEIEVFWPASGLRQRFHDVAVDRFLRITEGEQDYEVLDPPRVAFGG